MAKYPAPGKIVISFAPDDSEWMGAVQTLATGVIEGMNLLYESAEWSARQILQSEFDKAMAQENLFPQYETHINNALEVLPIDVDRPDVDNVIITINFSNLGTYADLRRGFHRGASTAMGQVELPYRGEALKNPFETRLEFWLNLLEGSPVPQEQGGAIQTAGMLDETLDDRVETWGTTKAPEWLLLEFGLYEGSPQVRAHHIMDNVETKLWAWCEAFLSLRVREAVATANRYRSFGYTPAVVKGGYLQAAGGHPITIAGKTYRGGQFIPWNPQVAVEE